MQDGYGQAKGWVRLLFQGVLGNKTKAWAQVGRLGLERATQGSSVGEDQVAHRAARPRVPGQVLA